MADICGGSYGSVTDSSSTPPLLISETTNCCKEKLQKLRRSTQRLEAQQAPLQQDIADLAAAATELLRLSGSVAEPAEKVFQQILSVTSDVEAAFTAALSVSNESLALVTCQNKRITDLEKEQARLQALAVFRDIIEVFRDTVAEKTGRASWQRLARDLYLERCRESKPARAEVASALTDMGLDLSGAGTRPSRSFTKGKTCIPSC